jgi:putative drug exporter of the RND superfamily
VSTAPSRALVAAVILYLAVGSLAAPLLPFTTLAASLLPFTTLAASLLPFATFAASLLPFATFAASLLPFATALVGVGTAYAGITLLGHAMTVAADFAPMLGGANRWLPRRLDKRMPRISNGLSEFRAA